MTRTKISIKYQLQLANMLHVGSGTGSKGFLDSYIYRDYSEKFGANVAVIPGSTIKGLLRDSLVNLADTVNVEEKILLQIFGAEDADKRGALKFSNVEPCECETEDINENIGVKYGTAVDRYRGVVKDMALFNSEILFAGKILFAGDITGWVDTGNANEIKEKLCYGLKWLTHIGGSKSAGMGRIVSVRIMEGA